MKRTIEARFNEAIGIFFIVAGCNLMNILGNEINKQKVIGAILTLIGILFYGLSDKIVEMNKK